MSSMIALFLFCVVLFFVISLKTYYNGKRVGLLPPSAVGALPIVGHTWLGLVKEDKLYEMLFEKILGSTLQKEQEVASCDIGIWKFFVCMDPDDAYVLLNSCLKKDAAYQFFVPSLGETGLIGADVPIWKKHRKLLNSTFNQSVLDSYLLEFNTRSRQMVQQLSQEEGKLHFDPLDYLKPTILQIICATSMGVSVDNDRELIEQFGKSVDIYIKCMTERIKKFYYHSDFIFNLSNMKKKQDAAVKMIKNFNYKVMQDKRAKMNGQEDKGTDTSSPRFKSFLDLLLELGRDGALSETEIQDEVNTFVGAAYDTTFHALGMMLLTIGSYPEVQQKIYDELQAVFACSTRDVERADMSKLKYLEAVIKETMRLYPVVTIVGRTVDKDLKLKKYTLPSGSRGMLSVYHVGRHRVWGADATQFRPERWLDGSLPASPGAYAVFGLGRRSCIGHNFAMMEMKTVLCHVLRQYRISGDVTHLVLNLDVVCTPASGHHISIERRDLM